MMSQPMTEEEASKDRYFKELGMIAERMIEAHGKDFAMGVLVLAARWIAEGKSFAAHRAGNDGTAS
jgi:hypothetical protein